MNTVHPLRALALSAGLAVAGAAAVVGLAPPAGTPTLTGTSATAVTSAATSATTAAAGPRVAAQGRVQPLPAPPVAEVLRVQQAGGLDCALSAGQVPICLHGEDLPGRDHAAGTSGGSTPTSGSIGCYGSGTDGPRVRAVYARPQSRPDRYAASLPSIRGWAAGVSRQFDSSAARTGGRRHVRFATTSGAGCTVTVLNVVLPDAAFRSFRDTIDALEARGLDSPSSKYLVWADITQLCGLATTYADDRPGPDNLNNGPLPSYARIDRGCWGKVEAHELVHMLGGVQTSARNSTGGFHCSDGLEVMCYDDGTSRSAQRSVCGTETRGLLDCRNDDYFSTSTPAGSYLQTHWNIARSAFLATTLSGATPSPAPTAARTSPAPSPSASPPASLVRVPELPRTVVPSLPPLPSLPPPSAPAVAALIAGALR